MPATKPRIAITLEPKTLALLDRIASSRDITKSEFLGELLEQIREPMERVVVLIEMAKNAPRDSMSAWLNSVQVAERELSPMVTSGLSQLDLLIHSNLPESPQAASVSKGGAAARDRRSAAERKGGPPSTNRGVPVGAKPSKVTKLHDARKARKTRKTGVSYEPV